MPVRKRTSLRSGDVGCVEGRFSAQGGDRRLGVRVHLSVSNHDVRSLMLDAALAPILRICAGLNVTSTPGPIGHEWVDDAGNNVRGLEDGQRGFIVGFKYWSKGNCRCLQVI